MEKHTLNWNELYEIRSHAPQALYIFTYILLNVPNRIFYKGAMMILSRKSNFICCIFSLFLLLTACNNGTTEKNYPGIDESEYDAKTRTLKDLRDNQVYKTTTIGTQIWMAQNLNFNTADGFCYYETPENCKIYGSLYIWSAAMDSAGVFSNNSKKCGYGKLCSAKEPIRGICPKGWHLPSKAEFNILIEADRKSVV